MDFTPHLRYNIKMIPRILKTTTQNSFFLFGARGTGKTTYITDAFVSDNTLYIDLLQPDIEDMYARKPETLEQQVRALPADVEWVLIDEIQKAPRLLDVTHRLIETSTRKFVLTGSSDPAES